MLIGLSLLFIVGILFSEGLRKLNLPHFLGIIIAGMLVGTFLPQEFYNVAEDLKKIALVILMTRVSFNLRVNEIKEIGPKAGLVSIVPPIVEVIGITIFFTTVFDYSVTSSLVMGGIMAASSPAISVPIMLKVKKERYGLKKHIPQMLVASGGVDNAFVLVMFYTLLGFELDGGFNAMELFNIPIAFIVGIALGSLMYLLVTFLINKLHLKGIMKVMVTLSTSFLLLGLESVLSQYVAYSGIIAILTVGIIILYREEALAHELSIAYKDIWSFIEILLFGIVGANIDIMALKEYLVLGIVVSVLAILLRLLGVYIALIKSGFNNKEKLYCGIAQSAKATVQASLGSIPLALGLPYGEEILAVSVLSIFIASPFSAIVADATYKKLLTKE